MNRMAMFIIVHANLLIMVNWSDQSIDEQRLVQVNVLAQNSNKRRSFLDFGSCGKKSKNQAKFHGNRHGAKDVQGGAHRMTVMATKHLGGDNRISMVVDKT